MTILLMNTEITAEINRMSCKKQQFHFFCKLLFLQYSTVQNKIQKGLEFIIVAKSFCTSSAVLVQLILFSLPPFFSLQVQYAAVL